MDKQFIENKLQQDNIKMIIKSDEYKENDENIYSYLIDNRYDFLTQYIENYEYNISYTFSIDNKIITFFFTRKKCSGIICKYCIKTNIKQILDICWIQAVIAIFVNSDDGNLFLNTFYDFEKREIALGLIVDIPIQLKTINNLSIANELIII